MLYSRYCVRPLPKTLTTKTPSQSKEARGVSMADSAPKAVFLPKKRVFKPKPLPEMPYIVAKKKAR